MVVPKKDVISEGIKCGDTRFDQNQNKDGLRFSNGVKLWIKYVTDIVSASSGAREQ